MPDSTFRHLIGEKAARIATHFNEHCKPLQLNEKHTLEYRTLQFYDNTILVRASRDDVSGESREADHFFENYYYFLFYLERDEELLLPIGDQNHYIYNANSLLTLIINKNTVSEYALFFFNFVAATETRPSSPLRFKILVDLDDIEYADDDATARAEARGALWHLLEGAESEDVDIMSTSRMLRHDIERSAYLFSSEYSFRAPVQFMNGLFRVRYVVRAHDGATNLDSDTEELLYQSHHISECRVQRRLPPPSPIYLERRLRRRQFVQALSSVLPLVLSIVLLSGSIATVLLWLFAIADIFAWNFLANGLSWVGSRLAFGGQRQIIAGLSIASLIPPIVMILVLAFTFLVMPQLGPQERDLARSRQFSISKNFRRGYKRLTSVTMRLFIGIAGACISFSGLEYGFDGDRLSRLRDGLVPFLGEAFRAIPGGSFVCDYLKITGIGGQYLSWISGGFRVFVTAVVIRGVVQFWNISQKPQPRS